MKGWIALAAAVWACGARPAPARAQNAQAPPPILLFYAPAGAGDAVRAARDALDQVARRRGTTLLDLSPRAPAAPTAPESLRRAGEAYRDFRYDAALKLLETAMAEAARTGAAGLSPAELSDLFIDRALVFTQRGDTARAWEDFTTAATLAPTRKLDPVRFSPRVIETFDRAVAAVTADPPVPLAIDAPAACAVFVDGRPTGDQRTVQVRRGEHYARVECPDRPAWGDRVIAQPDGAPVRPALPPQARPDRKAALERERRRGARTAIWAVVAATSDHPTLSMELVDLSRGKTLATVFARIGAQSAAEIATAADKLIDRIVAPPKPVVVAGPKRWYERPWVWGVGGMLAALAIILPLTLGNSSAPPIRTNVDYPH